MLIKIVKIKSSDVCWNLIGVVATLIVLIFIITIPITAPFIILIIFIRKIKSAYRLRLFRKRRAGCIYLVCNKRHGWYDFTTNNLFPVLPSDIKPLWPGSRKNDLYSNLIGNVSRSTKKTISKPYLVMITEKNARVVPLNRALQHLKNNAKICQEIQSACKATIESAKSELLEKVS